MKNKILIIALLLLLPQIVLASPNVSISTNASVIEKGKSVTATITLTDTAAWNIKIVGSGAASCSSKQADVTSNGKSTTKKFELKCKSTKEGIITFKVTGDITSGSGNTKDVSISKDVTVTKPKSGDNNLSNIKIDGASISGFSSSKTSYTLPDNSGKNINITANANDSKAKVSGTGVKNLNYGKNTFNITVTAENGSKKTYTIIVNKPDPRSTNNYLKLLSVDKGSINFNKNTTSYTVKLEHEISEIKISATAEDSKASVSGTGTKKLNDYTNEFKIVVKAENTSLKTYTIKVIRKDKDGNYGKLSTDNSVKSIVIKDYDFKFNESVKEYNVLVNENTNEVEFDVKTNDSASTVQIQNNTNLKPGLNKVKVQITAENGSTNEYTFNVYKIGKEKEEISTPEVQKEEPKIEQKEKFNIWIIISVIELLVIIVLIILFLIKKKNNKSEIFTETTSSNISS